MVNVLNENKAKWLIIGGDYNEKGRNAMKGVYCCWNYYVEIM